MIKVACSGFPVNQKKYQSQLQTVELSNLFDNFPRVSTVERWRATSTKDFEFIVCASRTITHPDKRAATHARTPSSRRIGYFQDSADVRQTFQKSWNTAVILNARLLLFQCPEHWTSHPDHVFRIQKFFKVLPRENKHFVWIPPLSWSTGLVENLSRNLGLSPATNPLSKTYKPTQSPMHYFRIGSNGKTSGQGALSDLELREIKKACDRPLSYVVFNNGPTAFSDAVRFKALL